MNSSLLFTRLSLIASFVATLCVFVFPSNIHAIPLDSWVQYSGSISSDLDTASPVLGDGTLGSESADGQTIYAVSPASYTLDAVGDSITLSGGVTFSGMVSPQADQFRFGFYDANGQAGATGWLGYFATNTGASTGPTYSRLWERDDPNSGSFGSGSGASLLAWSNASPSNTAFASGSYDFSLTATRSASGLDLVWSIVGTDLAYTVSGTVSDGTPESYTFNRVGFFTGGGLNADQVAFSDVSLNFVPIPESSAAAFLLVYVVGVFALGGRRR